MSPTLGKFYGCISRELDEVCRLLFWFLGSAKGHRRCQTGWGQELQKERFGLRLLVKLDRGCRRMELTLYNLYASPGRPMPSSDSAFVHPKQAVNDLGHCRVSGAVHAPSGTMMRSQRTLEPVSYARKLQVQLALCQSSF